MISRLNNLWQILFVLFMMNACATEEGTTQAVPAKAIATEKEKIPEQLKPKDEILPDSSISLEYLMGKFDPARDPQFVRIEDQYATRKGLLLHQETYEAFKKMHAKAKAEGIELRILSATRNFDTQKSIWEAKWLGSRKIENGKDASKVYPDPVQRALKILEYSSMPGTSRHHWGTDIDINNLNNSYFKSGKGLKEYQWLQHNAASFGFCQPYTAGRPAGYLEERWHWSYLPLAQKLTDQAKIRLKNEAIAGFKGAQTAKQIEVVKHYVLGINQDCL